MRGAFSQSANDPQSKTAARESIAKLNSNYLRDCIAEVVSAGAYIGLSATRDGGTIVVTLLNGQQQAKAYAQTADELKAVLADAVLSVSPPA